MNHSLYNMAPKKTALQKGGFTLTEIMVTLSVLSLLLPAVLAVTLQLNSQALSGVEHNNAVSEARHIQQVLVNKINASRSFEAQNDGDTLMLELFDPATSNWQDHAFSFVQSENSLYYSTPQPDGSMDLQELSSQVYRSLTNEIFSTSGNEISCMLYIGNAAPTDTSRTRGAYRNTGSYINMMVTPRNQSRIK